MSTGPTDETFWEKGKRKFTQEPLVPVGALVTTGFLISGLRAFHSGQRVAAQQLMRGRVAAQFFTVAAMGVGAYLGMKPSDRPKSVEEILQRKENGY